MGGGRKKRGREELRPAFPVPFYSATASFKEKGEERRTPLKRGGGGEEEVMG